MKRLTTPNWRLEFKGSSEPFIVPKIVTTNSRSLTRHGIELICGMQGCIYVYYIKNIKEPIEKRCMSMSICVTGLSQRIKLKFQQESGEEEGGIDLKHIWMFYRCSKTKNVKAVCLNKRQGQ